LISIEVAPSQIDLVKPPSDIDPMLLVKKTQEFGCQADAERDQLASLSLGKFTSNIQERIEKDLSRVF
jgi:hypothetical protein